MKPKSDFTKETNENISTCCDADIWVDLDDLMDPKEAWYMCEGCDHKCDVKPIK